MNNNAIEFDLAKSVGSYFRLRESKMYTIINEVLRVVMDWKSISKNSDCFSLPNPKTL